MTSKFTLNIFGYIHYIKNLTKDLCSGIIYRICRPNFCVRFVIACMLFKILDKNFNLMFLPRLYIWTYDKLAATLDEFHLILHFVFQLNEISPYIDGSLFYGPNKAWADSLRLYKDGLLAATNDTDPLEGYYPAYNDIRLPMANPPPPRDHVLKPVKRFFSKCTLLWCAIYLSIPFYL